MDKQLSRSTPPPNNSTVTSSHIPSGSITSRDRSSNYVYKTDQQKLNAISSEMESRNADTYYNLGKMLRGAWDYIAENFTFGLPTAEAGSVSAYSSDPEIHSAASTLHVHFMADEELKESISASPKAIKKMQKRADLLNENIRKEFVAAAEEGSETKDLVLKCLSGAKIVVLDPEYSQHAIKKPNVPPIDKGGLILVF